MSAPGPARARLDERLEAVRREFSGRIGLAARELAGGEEVLLDADTIFPTASVFKIAVMLEVFAQAAEGRLRLDRRLPVRAAGQVGGSGVLSDLAPGLRPTVLDLTTLMIIASDNTATNMLIDLVGGVGAVNHRLHTECGLTDIVLHGRIDFRRIGGDVRRLAEASPRALMELVARIAQGRVVDDRACRQMIRIMGRQLYLDQVPRYLDYHRYRAELGLPEDLRVACKTGVFPGVRADAGVMFTPGSTIAYCAMSEGSRDTTDAVENEASVANGRLGRLVLEHWWPEAGERRALLSSRYL